MASSPYFTALVNATSPRDVLDAVLLPFTSTMQIADTGGSIFYGLLFFAVIYMIYMKTQDITMPLVVTLLLGTFIIGFMPYPANAIAGSLTGLAFGIVLYRAYKSEK